jgi:DUF4097 and DUF4098 domain-containing protein YvlB
MLKHAKTFVLSVAIGLVATSAWADFKLERNLALEPGRSFTLETEIGAIVLTGDSPSGARVLVTSDADLDERYDFAFEETDRGVKVTVKSRSTLRRLFGGWWDHDTRFTIQVPSRTDVRLNTAGGSIDASRVEGPVVAETSGGSIRVEGIGGNVDSATSGGGIRVRNVRGNVTANTSGGSITVTDVSGTLRARTSGGGIAIDVVGGDLDASTSGGSVDVRGAGGRVEASSSGGGVTVRFASGNSRGGHLSSSGGSVRTELDPGAKVSIDASASGGSVNSDLPVTIQGRISSDSLRGDINGGGAVLRLRSSGGGVRITSTSRAAVR